MKLRNLKIEDANLMLEWMHDDFVVHDLATDFSKKSLEDCIEFIAYAAEQNIDLENCHDLHMAVVDDYDEYMGTVSLKNIDRERRDAEFAITVRQSAMGHGYSQYAMDEIIKLGFEAPELNLTNIYWCVDKKNIRARKFYDKQKYKIVEVNEDMMKNYNKIGGALS